MKVHGDISINVHLQEESDRHLRSGGNVTEQGVWKDDRGYNYLVNSNCAKKIQTFDGVENFH